MTNPAHSSPEGSFLASEKEQGYRTAPIDTDKLPPGIPYIVGNEAAERFSFYGMKAILAVFMTDYLLDSSGQAAPMSESAAKYWVHTFVFFAYFFPLIGAIAADWLLGKYRAIMALSVVYCLGHLALALDETRVGLAIGLSLIALGMGAIKPCVSAHVGDQFGRRNAHLMANVFGWFYLSINLGAFLSTLLTPILLKYWGPHVAFGVPGVLMAIATVVFWAGRNQFAHIPPRGNAFLRELTERNTLIAFARLVPIYLCVAAFWCLFDQTSSAWVLQAKKMDRDWLGIHWEVSQIQAANPLLILTLVPLFGYLIYPAIDSVWKLTPLRKIGLGMFLTVPAFAISALIEREIVAGNLPSIGWQVLAYVPLTAAEVMVSITCLEFSYTQAPSSMKSIVMSIYLLSVSLGNEFTAVVNKFIELPGGQSRLPGASYYWFFAGVMAVAAVIYVFVAITYYGKTVVQKAES
jgi:proton-dependent oligopeptide transporter, POT family